MRAGALICARTGSSRLPGKVLLPAPDGRPLLAVMLERVKRAQTLDDVIVVTTTRAKDDDIEDVARKAGVWCFRWTTATLAHHGALEPINDVLSLVYNAAGAHRLDRVVRLTADCPLVDPAAIDRAVPALRTSRYVETSPEWPEGLDVQAFDSMLLARSWQEATLPSDREHVVLHMKRAAVPMMRFLPPVEGSWGHIRVTLDYAADYEVISQVLEEVGPDCTTEQLIDLYERKPDVFQANAHIQRNEWQADAEKEVSRVG